LGIVAIPNQFKRSPPTLNMVINLSPSTSLPLFLNCPRCFWLEKIKKIKRPSGPFPSLPNGMDRILKQHFDTHRSKKTLPKALEGKFSGSLYPDLKKLDVWRNNFKGLQHEAKPGFILKGALDDLFVTSSRKYAPLDFKTRGYPRKEDTHEYYQLQMDSYALLLEKNGMKTAGFAILLFYHPLKVNREHHVEFNADPVKIPTNPKNAENVMQQAISCLQGKEPKVSKECGFCRWLDNSKTIS